MKIFEQIIIGELASKSNSRQIVKNKSTGEKMVIKSEKARLYHDAFLYQVRRPKEPYPGPVTMYVRVFYASERPDLDIALLQDCLQVGTFKNPGSGIIKNDRQVRELHVWHGIDKQRPRVEVQLYELGTGPQLEISWPIQNS